MRLHIEKVALFKDLAAEELLYRGIPLLLRTVPPLLVIV